MGKVPLDYVKSILSKCDDSTGQSLELCVRGVPNSGVGGFEMRDPRLWMVL